MGFFDFMANEPGSYEAMTLRQRIALAQMMKKSAYPKTLGEGLSSIGDSLGDAFNMRTIERQAAEMRAKDEAAGKGVYDDPDLVRERRADAPADPLDPRRAALADEPPIVAAKPPIVATAPPTPPPPRNAPLASVQYPEPTGPGPATTRGMVAQPPPGQQLATNMVTPPTQRPPFPDPDKALEEPPGPGSSFNDRFAGEPTFGNAYGNHPGQRMGAMGWLPDAQQANASMTPPPGAPPSPQMAGGPPPPPPGPMGRGPQLASRGDLPIQNDASPVGALGPGMDASVRNSAANILMQRGEPPAPPPQPAPPPGPQLAQAPGGGPFPPVGARPQAILPGGGLPPTPPQIQPAPPDPRGVIRAAPQAAAPAPDYEPPDRPMPQPPSKPGPGPIELKYRGYETRDLGPQAKGAAKIVIQEEQNRRNAVYENEMKKHEVERADWLKQQEQRRDFLRHRNYEKNREAKEGGQAVQEIAKGNRIEQQLDTEQKQREAQLQKQIAEGGTAAENFAFLKRTGQEREPFIKDFKARRDDAVKSAAFQKNFLLAKEAANSGFLISGKGANLGIDLAKMGATLGIKDSKELAYQAEVYQRALDGTVSYGASLIQPGDSRMTEADLLASKGLSGSPELQLRSKQKLIDIALEDQHRKINEYEDLREQYFRGDPSHRFLKVDAPTIGKDTRRILLEHRDNEQVRERFDRQFGPGAAQLEINRAKRREAREDD